MTRRQEVLRSAEASRFIAAECQRPMLRIAAIFHRFGPYHVSRLNRAARYLDVYGFELSGTDRVYAWERTDGREEFPRQVISPDVEREPTRRLVAQVARMLSACWPQVVAIPGWSHRGALAALLWCARSGTPVVLMSESTSHDYLRHPWREALKRRIVSLCSSALVGGTPHRQYLAELGMPIENIVLGYDVVDNDHFRRGADAARARPAEHRRRLGLPEKFFLASCRFVAKKNLPCLLKAFAEYRRAPGSAWDLVLLGDGPLRPQLVDQLGRTGLADAVRMPGFVQYDDLPAYYGLAGAFIHPSTTEQWGLVVNEAMASGLPVIVSERCGCVADLIVPGVNGFTFDPFDGAELCRLMTLVSSPQCERHWLMQRGRAIIAQWDADRFARGLRDAANLAISAGNKGRRADRAVVRLMINRKLGND